MLVFKVRISRFGVKDWGRTYCNRVAMTCVTTCVTASDSCDSGLGFRVGGKGFKVLSVLYDMTLWPWPPWLTRAHLLQITSSHLVQYMSCTVSGCCFACEVSSVEFMEFGINVQALGFEFRV